MARSGNDVVIVGGGPNSLVAAAYLARAGRSVRLLERASVLGGTVATDEVADCRVPAVFPSVELFHPRIRRQLELERHGLRLLRPRGGTLLLRPQGPHLQLSADGEADGGISIADAAALGELETFVRRLTRTLEPLWTGPLPPLAPSGLPDLIKLGLRLRRLGSRQLSEGLRALPMNLADLLGERIEDEGLKAAIAAPALTASWLGPRSAGSVLGLLHHRPAWTSGLTAPPTFAEGGPGALTAALAKAAEAAGARLETECEVTGISVANNRACGVVNANGDEVPGRAVVSGLDPRRTLFELAGPALLAPELAERLATLRGRGNVSVLTLVLEGRPEIARAPAGTEHLAGRVLVGSSLDALERAADAAKYGRLPEEPQLEITLPSLTDPTLAPPGRQVMTIWVQPTPYELRDDSWENARERLAEQVTATLERYAPGITERIVERRLLTPPDLERRFGLSAGCLYQVEMALDQMLWLRPLPGWYRHRTPIDGLYLCGSAAHPGGGVTGLPGHNAARQLLADWRQLA